MKFEIQNTQNKIYNIPRRSYLDKGDFKEGESFCKKCGGIGQVTHDGGPINNCSQCLGRGIVDWITQAVVRPSISMTNSSSGSSSSSMPERPKPPPPRIIKEDMGVSDAINMMVNLRNKFVKKVTNYKRRKVV